jgi:sodium transport system ATP-binding protein
MIEARQLTKVYHSRKEGRVAALDGMSMSCAAGQVYALLGANGAGKTTLLRILSTLIEPTSGSAAIGGLSVADDKEEVRRRIGVVSYETGVYERMTPREIAFLFGRLNGLADGRIERNLEACVEMLRMQDFVDRRTDAFSTGMKQKTVILRALITDPQVLLFDEPTAGLDLATAKSVSDHIRMLRDHGKTVLLTTHILWEAERLADTIGILAGGRLVAEGTLAELRARTGCDDIENIFFTLTEPSRSEPCTKPS